MDKNLTKTKTLIGMIHVPALPGTPSNTLSPDQILEVVMNEARIYSECGVNTIILENMHDLPYLKRTCGPEIVSLMSILCFQVKNKYFKDKLVGVQILAGCNKQSLAVAYNSGCDFIRAEGFVFASIADEGFMDADAGELLRYRKQIGADKIKIFTDIKKKHSANLITDDVKIGDFAENAEFCMSDGIIVSGSSTGKESSLEDLDCVRKQCKLPILIGSGITVNNLEKYFDHADAFIVGTYFKKDGNWKNELDVERIKSLVELFEKLCKQQSKK